MSSSINSMFRYDLGPDVRPGDRIELITTDGLRHTIDIPNFYVSGMSLDSDVKFESHRIIRRAAPVAERVDEDAEDVDFNYDEGTAG